MHIESERFGWLSPRAGELLLVEVLQVYSCFRCQVLFVLFSAHMILTATGTKTQFLLYYQ